MKTRSLTVQEIVSFCGGPEAIAPKAGRSIWAIYKWFGNGIPEKHWDLVMSLSDVTLDEIYQANRAARFRNGAQAVACTA